MVFNKNELNGGFSAKMKESNNYPTENWQSISRSPWLARGSGQLGSAGFQVHVLLQGHQRIFESSVGRGAADMLRLWITDRPDG